MRSTALPQLTAQGQIQSGKLVQSLTNLFRTPSAEMLAQRELENNKRMLLEAQRAKDYYTKMAEFYDTRLRTLTAQLKKAAEE